MGPTSPATAVRTAVRANLRRGGLGDDGARDAAGAFAAEIDNPEVVEALQAVTITG